MSLAISLTLCGYWGLPQVEAEVARAPVILDLPPGVSLQGLLAALADQYGERFRQRVLTESGEVRRTVRVFVDDQPIDSNATDVGPMLNGQPRVRLMLLAAMSGG